MRVFFLIPTALLLSNALIAGRFNTDYQQFTAVSSQWNKCAYAEFDLNFVCSFADVNSNLSVNLEDLLIISENWIQCGTLYDIGLIYTQNQNIRKINEAIQFYYADHGHLPGEGNSSFEQSLYMKTDVYGTAYPEDTLPNESLFGRYVDNIPHNYFSHSTMVTVRIDGPPAGAGLADWRFSTQTGLFESDYEYTMETISYHNNPIEFWGYIPLNIFNGLRTMRYDAPESAGANTHGWVCYGDYLLPDDIGIPTTPDGGLTEIDSYKILYLCDVLMYVRCAITQYRWEHHWQNPGQGPTSFGESLTKKTNESGELFTEEMENMGVPACGPYLPIVTEDQFLPKNPFNNLSTARIGGAGPGQNTHGWCYQSDQGYFYTDDNGIEGSGVPHVIY